MRTRPRRTSVCRVDEGKIATPQLRERQFAAAGRKLRENRRLLFGERGQAAIADQDGEALHAPRIALGGCSLARNPLFAHHARPIAATKPPWRCAASKL